MTLNLYLTKKRNWYILENARGWLSPGGLRGLQNRLRGAAEAALVGSTPIHSRLQKETAITEVAATAHKDGPNPWVIGLVSLSLSPYLQCLPICF